MNRFIDLQFIIGLYFSLTGIILITHSFFITSPHLNQSINLFSGLGITAFGIFMLLAFWIRDKSNIKKG